MEFVSKRFSIKRTCDALRKLQSDSSQDTSPFPDIAETVSRPLPITVPQKTRRRGSSLKSLLSPLCDACRQLDLGQAPGRLAYSTYSPDGVLLGKLQNDPTSSKCPLCQVLAQACRETCLAAQGPADPYAPLLQLRAFHLLPYLHEQWYQGRQTHVDNRSSEFFVAAVPSQFSMVPGGSDRALFDDMVSKRGFLVYHQDTDSVQGRNSISRLVSAHFDPCVVQKWLRVCISHHDSCRIPQRSTPVLNLIDCRSRKLISTAEMAPNTELRYVALSYVWGNSLDVSGIVLDACRLPSDLPSVINDAIEAVLKLGYTYLWVDKYCVDHHDECKKHEQLMHMGYVYKNAILTIVAAAGHDESYGLPGVTSARPLRQISFSKDGVGYELRTTLPLPHSSIEESKWASRGWTYQEAVLSPRRLVFTEDQLYFECNSASCSEGFDISFNNMPSIPGSSHGDSVRRCLFSLPGLVPIASGSKAARLSNFLTYIHCAEQYSKRALTFDRDSLIAFSGITRILESIRPFPVRHIWGVPFFHPNDDNLTDNRICQLSPVRKILTFASNSEPKRLLPNAEGIDYLAYLMLGLCWRHVPSEKPFRRRHDLPSWSWTGWEGVLAWPKLSEDADIRSSTWAETAISLTSDSSVSVPEIYHKSTDAHLLAQSNKSLHIRTSAISSTAFVFNESSSSLALVTGSDIRVYPSKDDLDASKIFRRIHSERYEVIKLATVDEVAYMMLIKRYRNAYYRIGTMAVEDMFLTYSLFTSKIQTFKLR
ncbi:heterokaryon incompatibility protein-domain-containing protein [Xylaria arbuscula]|nr:heterokaryon incompatibility protein-domain-containing protein [Xylaria arbuscula]